MSGGRLLRRLGMPGPRDRRLADDIFIAYLLRTGAVS